MQAPYCKGLEKLLTLLIHKLDPADWPGATDVVASIFLCEQEERNKKGGTRGEKWKGGLPYLGLPGDYIQNPL